MTELSTIFFPLITARTRQQSPPEFYKDTKINFIIKFYQASLHSSNLPPTLLANILVSLVFPMTGGSEIYMPAAVGDFQDVHLRSAPMLFQTHIFPSPCATTAISKGAMQAAPIIGADISPS